jgi:hypothetical protein
VDIDYPSEAFTKRCLHLLRDGQHLTIHVRGGWRSRWLQRHIDELPTSELEARLPSAFGKRSLPVGLQILMMPISTVHFFALSGGYKMSHSVDSGLLIKYART